MSNIDSMLIIAVATLASCFVLLYLPWTYIKGKARTYDVSGDESGAEVAGWLLLILVTVFSTGPFFSALVVIALLSSAREIGLPQYTTYAYAIGAVIIGLNVWAMRLHSRLITTRRKSAVDAVKKFYLYLPFALLTAPWLLSSALLKADLPLVHDAVVREALINLFSSVVTSALYYWYFAKSKRVARLYSDTSSPLQNISPKVSRERINHEGQFTKNEPRFAQSSSFGSSFDQFPRVQVSETELFRSLNTRVDSADWESCLAKTSGDEVAALALYLSNAHLTSQSSSS